MEFHLSCGRTDMPALGCGFAYGHECSLHGTGYLECGNCIGSKHEESCSMRLEPKLAPCTCREPDPKPPCAANEHNYDPIPLDNESQLQMCTKCLRSLPRDEFKQDYSTCSTCLRLQPELVNVPCQSKGCDERTTGIYCEDHVHPRLEQNLSAEQQEITDASCVHGVPGKCPTCRESSLPPCRHCGRPLECVNGKCWYCGTVPDSNLPDIHDRKRGDCGREDYPNHLCGLPDDVNCDTHGTYHPGTGSESPFEARGHVPICCLEHPVRCELCYHAAIANEAESRRVAAIYKAERDALRRTNDRLRVSWNEDVAEARTERDALRSLLERVDLALDGDPGDVSCSPLQEEIQEAIARAQEASGEAMEDGTHD